MTKNRKFSETARLRYGASTDAAKLGLAIRGSNGGSWELRLNPDDPARGPVSCELSADFKAILGYEATELPDTVEAFLSLVHPEDRAGLEAVMKSHLRGRTDRHDLNYRIRHADGSIRWLRSCGQVVYDDEGRAASWVGIEWDITEDVQREEVLRLSRTKYAALFHLSPVPCALLSFPEGRFLEVNEAFEESTGRRSEDILGRTDLDLGLWEDPSQRRGVMRRLVRGGCRGVVIRLRLRRNRLRAVELAADRLTLDHGDCVLVVGRDVTEERAAEERLMDKAFRDPLMGLPNRHAIEKELRRRVGGAGRDGLRTAALFIDLDRLKSINDSLGHEAGDELLATAAQRLRLALRPQDFLARFGGDELLALARVRDAQEAINLSERLLARLRSPVLVAGTTLTPSASIGVAVAEEALAQPWDLVRAADAAMYQAKRLGGDKVRLLQGDFSQQEDPDFQVEVDLHLAIQRQQLEVVYQPIVWLSDLAPWGTEVFLRWSHPRRGTIPPAELVPLAEATGMIVPLGKWALEQACGQVASWQRAGLVGRDFVVSVNLSARQLRDESLTEHVGDVLRETALPPGSLQLELAERIVPDFVAVTKGLRELGVRLAVDNFAEGLATLRQLRALRARTLKLDRTVIRSLPGDVVDRSLVGAVVHFAGQLGIHLVAEGVEAASELRHLRDLGCPLGQGFLFAEPLPAAQFSQSLSTYHRLPVPAGVGHRRPAAGDLSPH